MMRWSCFYSQADVRGGASLSVKLRSRRAAILAHASAAYFNLFLSAAIDARAARSRHCLACCLYSATTCIASRYYAGRTAGVCAHPDIDLWITYRAATPRTYTRHQNSRIGGSGVKLPMSEQAASEYHLICRT